MLALDTLVYGKAEKDMYKNKIVMLCEGENRPLGIDEKNPRFSWKIENGCGIECQTAYQLLVAETKEALEQKSALCWKAEAYSDCQWVRYAGICLKSRQVYYWKLILTYDACTILESEAESFETGLLENSDWSAEWISPAGAFVQRELPPIREDGTPEEVPLEEMEPGKVWRLRKEFSVSGTVKCARLYATAHGVYCPILDGEKIGTYELMPGHMDYRSQLAYQIYDVTDQLTKGEHVLAAVLANGWYAGCIGFYGENCLYGDQLALLMQLMVTYEDGREEIIATDETFQAEESAWLYADLMIGEKMDGRKRNTAFFKPGYHAGQQVLRVRAGYQCLFAQTWAPIEILEEISPVSLWKTKEREWVADFGTCIAGKVRLSLLQPFGQEIRIEHSEVLDREGNFIRNIREPYKNQTDIYICHGKGREQYEPMFTYHGFRYIRILGITGEIHTEDLTALVIGSRMEQTGSFSCSNDMLNRLQKNILRSQVSNMVSIPTDCPQREKSGWTGDVQVYGETACFNQDVRQFFRQWLRDVRFNQNEKGEIPIIVPALNGAKRAFEDISSSAGWGDVIVSLPWALYQYYGDSEVLEENYEAMERWVEYQRSTAEQDNPEETGPLNEERKQHLKFIWNTGFHFGDWLTPSASLNLDTGDVEMMQSAVLTMDIVPTIFFGMNCKRMSEISKILCRQEQAEYYDGLFSHIRSAFQYEFVDEQQQLKSRFQGIHVLALHAGLLEGEAKKNAEARLVELIHQNGDKLDTGFLSTPFLLDVLTEIEQDELACRILMNEECPSWLYEIRQGATSIWESWQAVLPDGRCSYLSMAHYACGSVGSFLYHYFGGLYPLEPGFKKIRFAPRWDRILSHAEVEYESVYGKIACAWQREKECLKIRVMVPANTEAEIELPELDIWKTVKPGTYEYEFVLPKEEKG